MLYSYPNLLSNQATAVWLINEIASGESEYREVLDSVTWYILPVMNADGKSRLMIGLLIRRKFFSGYQFSWDENRLWRKTRSVHNILCRGVDANRNFGFSWRSLYSIIYMSTQKFKNLFSGRLINTGMRRHIFWAHCFL